MCEIVTSAGNSQRGVLLPENLPATYRALDFDSLYANCKYSCISDVNNGYGCSHPKQEETGESDIGESEGKCYCWSCPLGVEFSPGSEEEDADALKNNPNIHWAIAFDAEDDSGPDADEIEEGGCLLVNDGTDATDDELDAIRRHDAFLTRYNR